MVMIISREYVGGGSLPWILLESFLKLGAFFLFFGRGGGGFPVR